MNILKFLSFVFALFVFYSCNSDDDNDDGSTGNKNYFRLEQNSSFNFRLDHYENSAFVNENHFVMSQAVPNKKSDGFDYYPFNFSYNSSSFLGNFKDLEITKVGNSIYAIGTAQNSHIDLGLHVSFPFTIDNKLKILNETLAANQVIEERKIIIDEFDDPTIPALTINAYFKSIMLSPQKEILLSNANTFNDILNTKSTIDFEIKYFLKDQTVEIPSPIGGGLISAQIVDKELTVLDRVEIQTSFLSFANSIGLVRDQTIAYPSRFKPNNVYAVKANIIGFPNPIDIELDFENKKVTVSDSYSIDFDDINNNEELNKIADFLNLIKVKVQNEKNYHQAINELNSFSYPSDL